MDPVREVLDEVEQGRFGPLQVVEHDDDRAVGREPLEEAADRPEELLDGCGLGGDPERLGQPGEDRLGVLDPGEAIAQSVHDRRGVGFVVEPDRRAEELRDRIPGDPLAVRQASAAEDGRRPRARPGEELVDEPALADAGRPEHRDEDAALLDDGPLEGGAQDPEFAIATDHRTADAAVDRLGRLVDGDEASDGDRLVAALDLDLAWLAGDHGVADEAPGRVADERLARFGRLLEASGDVHRVAGRPAAAGPRIADDDRAGVDADAHRDLETALGPEGCVQGRQRGLHLGGRPDRPERVVLVHDRDAEDGDDRIADELLDRSAVALEDRAHRVEPAAHDRAQRLRVEVLAEPGRAGDVGEHDGDDLARLARRLGRGERRAARHAEAGDVGVLGRAVRAGDHR